MIAEIVSTSAVTSINTVLSKPSLSPKKEPPRVAKSDESMYARGTSQKVPRIKDLGTTTSCIRKCASAKNITEMRTRLPPTKTLTISDGTFEALSTKTGITAERNSNDQYPIEFSIFESFDLLVLNMSIK
jgi:hypothetical protein